MGRMPWRPNIEIQNGRATGTSRLIMPWEEVGMFGSDGRRANDNNNLPVAIGDCRCTAGHR